ncbi:MAG: bifunctional riboflavin kinase/FAD synthetase [Lachnospiraceae bacterium]|nr:bifunctional riboflavin kinase/FAD synthetase [Lachnospiraceae bacterium]
MKIISDTINVRIDEPTVVTIGKFDGIHKGHADLFKQMERFHGKGLKTVVFTFDLPTALILRGEDSKVLTTREEKRYIFEKLGIDYLVEFPFNEMTASISAEEFIDDFLATGMNMRAIVMGRDCRFGHRGLGTPEMLKRYSHNYGYEVEVIEKYEYDGDIISSTIIRKAIQNGDIITANKLLLYPYFFYGEVVHGNKLGRQLGMPTVNLIPKDLKLLVPNGVYFSTVEYNGKIYNAITNIGRKPTVEGVNSDKTGIETYIYDFDEQIYGEMLSVSLYDFLREEIHFESLDLLKKQIEEDVNKGKIWHKNHKSD